MSVMYEELRRNQEMDSTSIGHSKQQHSGVLMRYSSAPSSFFTSLIDNNNNTHSYANNEESFTTSNSEMDTMLSKLISTNNGWNNSSEPLQEFGVKVVKQEESESNGYSYGGSELTYQDLSNGSSNSFYGSFVGVNSMDSENCTQSKIGVRNCSNLIRQKSSPAGFFSSENGLATLRELEIFKANEISNAQTRGFHGTLNFSSTCLKRMPQIAENGIQSIDSNCDQGRDIINENGSTKCHMPSFNNEFWDNSSFNAQKVESEDEIMFSTTNGLESQEGDFCYQNLGLTHQLSLPSSSTKMTSIEKFLQIQGSAPCKIRAKRGFATHPRSIAERVRRTRISERIKKLEGLFPKLDKQTNTADMLDLAVEYIKDLQGQVQILTDCREKCKCTSNEKLYTKHCS
ncbi:transcription factor bHLH130-like [Cicer arietinum]|uniref:Transcription factor bHLH130-like n=1 Tax=Cicer arietinum TaxID=3827 RepID=A0A1S2Z5T1_CICAR|nr:transcription factor bHLH130-like [Cicer arietinum]